MGAELSSGSGDRFALRRYNLNLPKMATISSRFDALRRSILRRDHSLN
jgi:hypothetical protein